MTTIKPLLAAAFAAVTALAPFAAAPGGGPSCRSDESWRQDPWWIMQRELFFAVLEGCYRDGVLDQVVDRILALDLESGLPAHFVQGCPICMPAMDALRVYRRRVPLSTKPPTDTFGAGLEQAEVSRLISTDRSTRMEAIEGLIQRWVAARMDELRLTGPERAAWTRWMEEGRKKGMASLQSLQDSGVAGAWSDAKACAFCDGANGACRPR